MSAPDRPPSAGSTTRRLEWQWPGRRKAQSEPDAGARRYRLTALISAVVVLLLVIALAFVPVPFVSWAPGRTVDVLAQTEQGKPIIQVSGLATRKSKADLRMTTVSVTTVDGRLSLIEALSSYWLPHRDVLQREAVYPSGQSADEVRAAEVQSMDTSQRDAVVAALRAAGQPVTAMPMIEAVTVGGPAYNVLVPGDLVGSVDGTAVQSVADVQRAIRRHRAGDSISMVVLRNGVSKTVQVVTSASRTDPKVPMVGISLDTGYRYAPTVTFGVPASITGPSAGLVLSLGVYETIASTDLLGDLNVAGTGEISPDGTVGAIGGIHQKIAGAQRAGSKIFLVPAANCQDIKGVSTRMTLVKVSTLKDAISALQKLRQGTDVKEIPHC
ncbi:MAG: PDZ domain-containing protein [Acidipropionibacterium sp.]|nr:PDZ domain-containing protein [Acidipropionibacterium sp.]